MRTAGGSTRRDAAYRAIAFGVALLIAPVAFDTTALAAGGSAAADTTSADALYEPVAPAPVPAKSAAGATLPAATSTSSPSSSEAAAAEPADLDSDGDAPAAAASPPPAVTTETVIVPASMPAPSYIKQGAGLPPSTTEIPQSAAGAPPPGTAEIDPTANAEAVYYEAQQNPQMIDPQLHSLQEFMSEGPETSPLGLDLHEDQRKLNSGEIANGLVIVGVRAGSPAAKVGLRSCGHTERAVVTGVAVAAAMFFPPAVMAIPFIEQANLGDTYDMIIGVDGNRVTNFLDFEDRMRDLQPGETVYLSIVRNGNRMQVPVPVGSMSIAPF